MMIYFSIQKGLGDFQLSKTKLKRLYKNREITYLEYKLLLPVHKNELDHVTELVRINIYEAGITEFKHGLRTNAISAYELCEQLKHNPPIATFKKKIVKPENDEDVFYSSISEKNNLFPVINTSQSWVGLYITWNMAFVLNDVDNLHLVFPKLLIPSIINCESEDFLGVRFVSLWLILNCGYFRMYDHQVVPGPENRTEMARAWASINKKYAFNLAKRETQVDSEKLMSAYNKFFTRPVVNTVKLLKILLS